MNELRRQRLEEIANGSGYSAAEICALCADALETIDAQAIVVRSSTAMMRLIRGFTADQGELALNMVMRVETLFNDSELQRAAAVLDLKLQKDA